MRTRSSDAARDNLYLDSIYACTGSLENIIFNHMVNYQIAQINSTFSALSDPTRRAIISRLCQGPLSVGELAQPFDMSLPAVSKHIKILNTAGLLRQDRKGRTKLCTLIPGPLKNADQWLQFYKQFWDFQFDALGNYLESTSSTQ